VHWVHKKLQSFGSYFYFVESKAKGGNNVRWSDMNDMKGIGDV